MDSRTTIYLDQSRVSELVKVTLGADRDAGGAHRPAYQALHSRLRELVAGARVVCPFSLWHAVESAQFDDDDVRLGVCSFFDWASGGKSFRFYLDVFEAELGVLAGLPPVDPLGDAADCFPAGETRPLTRELLDVASRPFTIIVEMLRQDHSLRDSIIVRRDAILDGLRKYVVKYHGDPDDLEREPPPLPPASAIRWAFGLDVLRTHLRQLVDRGMPLGDAEKICLRVAPAIRDRSWADAGVPNLGAWTDVFAERVHRGGKVDTTPKRRGEAFDLGHMAALAASDLFLMERKFVGIGEAAARLSKTTLVHSPADLLDSLARL